MAVERKQRWIIAAFCAIVIFVTAWCFLGCGFACTVGLKNMYYGINKYVVADDD